MNNHFCTEHNSPLLQMTSKTKTDDNGNPKTFWAHHGPQGFCFGDGKKSNGNGAPKIMPPSQTTNSDSMLRCNAMNNTISYLVANGKSIWDDDFNNIFNRILNTLESQT